MLSLKKIYTTLFFLGLFFIPFNDFEGLSFLGEYKNEAATYFFLIGFFVLIIESLLRGKICVPYKNLLALTLILFIVWTFVSTMINFQTVSQNFYKQTTGFNRYARQTISLLISAVLFTVFFWNVIRNYKVERIFKLIRKVFLVGLIFVSIYGFIEIGIVYFGLTFLKPVFEAFEVFPFVNTRYMGNNRISISSVTYEVPALGNYLITIMPWMFSYIITEKKWTKFIPVILGFILMHFSDSRTALICLSIQLIVFIAILIHDERYRKTTLNILKIGSLGLAALLVFNSKTLIETVSERADRINFSKNLNADVSNKSRFGMQYASIQVFKENPVVGVGLGQDTYHKIHHYPYWSTVNNWEFTLKYQNQQDPSFPSAYNIYTRLLSELGLIGILIFFTLLFLCFYYSIMYWKFSANSNKYMGVILILSFAGLFVNWMQTDFFRQYGVWLCIVLLIHLRASYTEQIKEN